jgi:hypothetical protein
MAFPSELTFSHSQCLVKNLEKQSRDFANRIELSEAVLNDGGEIIQSHALVSRQMRGVKLLPNVEFYNKEQGIILL